MKKLWMPLLLVAAAGIASAQPSIGISVQIGQPRYPYRAYRRPIVVAPPPAYYAPPPAYYAPPPVYIAPRRAYYGPPRGYWMPPGHAKKYYRGYDRHCRR